MPEAEDLTGRIFGMLRVLRRGVPASDAHGPLWDCLCDPALGGCGREKTFSGRSIRPAKGRRPVIACGCQIPAAARFRAAASADELIGETVAGMEVLAILEETGPDGEATYRVRCPKGAEHVLTRHALRSRGSHEYERCYYCPVAPAPAPAPRACATCGETFTPARSRGVACDACREKKQARAEARRKRAAWRKRKKGDAK